MKLSFVFKTDKKLWVFDTFKQIKAKVDDADEGFYYYMRALELNESFLELIQWYRKTYDIPLDGYEYSDKDNIKLPSDFDTQFQMFHINEYSKEVRDSNLLLTIAEFIPYIGLFNRVPVIKKTHLTWEPVLNVFSEDDYKDYELLLKKEHRQNLPKDFWDHSMNMLEEYEKDLLNVPYAEAFISIGINISSVLTKSALLHFIEKKWDEMDYYMKHVRDYNDQEAWRDFYISERDLDIVRMHKFEKMSFKAIGDSFEKKGNYDLYEDVVKTAYHRAIKKIDSLLIRT